MFLYVKFAYLLKARISFIIGEILNEQKNSHQYINFFYHNLGAYIDNLKFVGLIRNYICILANFLRGWKSYSVLSVRTVSLLKPFIVRCEITHLSFPNTGLSVLLLRQRGDHSTAGSCGCDGVSGFSDVQVERQTWYGVAAELGFESNGIHCTVFEIFK